MWEQFVATMWSKHPDVRVTVKRMSTAHIVVLSIAPGAGGIAASIASGSAEPAMTLADAGAAALALRAITAVANAAENIAEHQASKRNESVNGVRPGAAILTRAQK
jgi:16S rRNA G1207 methylase RsmC